MNEKKNHAKNCEKIQQNIAMRNGCESSHTHTHTKVSSPTPKKIIKSLAKKKNEL